MDEIPSFREDVARIYRQMLLCQETEKIDKKMREEIIPEMLKNVSSMKNIRFGFEENDEENDDKNPDWEDAFEQSGLGDKLRRNERTPAGRSRCVYEHFFFSEKLSVFSWGTELVLSVQQATVQCTQGTETSRERRKQLAWLNSPIGLFQ